MKAAVRKNAALALLALLSLPGCGYSVHVYGEPAAPGEPTATLPAGASVHVRPHPNAAMLDLHDRARGRIETSLQDRGFTLASAKEADYVLFFDCVSKEGVAGSKLWPGTGRVGGESKYVIPFSISLRGWV